MKKGKIIFGDEICLINFSENPTLTVEEKRNEDGTKSLTGYQKWNPLKISFINKYSYELAQGKYDYIFISPNGSDDIFKLIDCVLNLENNEIQFHSCILY